MSLYPFGNHYKRYSNVLRHAKIGADVTRKPLIISSEFNTVSEIPPWWTPEQIRQARKEGRIVDPQ